MANPEIIQFTNIFSKKKAQVFNKTYEMTRNTQYLILGIAILSILAGIYEGVKTEKLIDVINGVFIGLVMMGIVIVKGNK